jgi:rubrerythrin
MDTRLLVEHALKLERQSEVIYRRLVQFSIDQGRLDTSEFYYRMAEHCREHYEAIERLATKEFGILSQLPNGDAPALDSPVLEGYPATLADLDEAMALALQMERSHSEVYEKLASTNPDSDTHALAIRFAREELEHALEIERFMGAKPY